MKTFDDYKGILPYASELLGVYQPLLGWKSRILEQRYTRFRQSLYDAMATRSVLGARAQVRVQIADSGVRALASASIGATAIDVSPLAPVDFARSIEPHVSTTIDSGIARMILSDIGSEPPQDWSKVITPPSLEERLKQFQDLVTKPEELQKHPELAAYVLEFGKEYGRNETKTLLEELFEKECKIAGYLLFLAQHTPSMLDALFFQSPRGAMLATARAADPLLNFGSNQYEAILSPIGVIHLYREYFFELDSFLGPPVGHVWLSPGGTVELLEVSSRRTLTEQTVEESLETTTGRETSRTDEDEIADAVKEDNQNNIKFGFSNTASFSVGVVSDSATADLAIEFQKSRARETTHKQMRQQSEKLSSEIKRNFRTTFRTSSELTDTSSKRYVIQNTTDRLVNYELRRKMRKVGVQVQDIGIALCWHTFVDDPGRELGIAKLVHMGEPPHLADLVQPDAPPMPTPTTQEVSVSIPFVGLNTSDTDIAYTDGIETEVGFFDSEERIQADFEQRVMFATPGYTLVAVDLDPSGADALLSARNLVSTAGSSAGSFTIHLDYVSWHGQNQIAVKMRLWWEPGKAVRDAATTEYNARMESYNNEKARRFKEAFYAAARERIKLASGIAARRSEDLREEERTVVYRALVSQLMSAGTDQSKHVTSELVRSMFDVDKMLYFVAPEWWAPRLHRSRQHLGEEPPTGGDGVVGPAGPVLVGGVKARAYKGLLTKLTGAASTSGSSSRGTSITSESVVDWGGAKELNRDNYFITEDSEPAKMGSSLGWLLQLDGDSLRNAFLNSPWVKAVIPIRIGKEREALNWLQQAHVEGADGLEAEYVASPEDPEELHSTPTHTVTIREALERLIESIHEFDRNARMPVTGNPLDPDDPSHHYAGSLPAEAVFEHGFYPLKGGVRFDGEATAQTIFSQWIEILPTDQVAALEVRYDPKTLQVIDEREEEGDE
jgi:hypothetical protein